MQRAHQPCAVRRMVERVESMTTVVKARSRTRDSSSERRSAAGLRESRAQRWLRIAKHIRLLKRHIALTHSIMGLELIPRQILGKQHPLASHAECRCGDECCRECRHPTTRQRARRDERLRKLVEHQRHEEKPILPRGRRDRDDRDRPLAGVTLSRERVGELD